MSADAAQGGSEAAVAARDRDSACVVWCRQLRVMLKKNALQLIRNKRSTIVQLLVPVILVVLLFVIQFGLRADPENEEIMGSDPRPAAFTVDKIAECVRFDGLPCTTLAYSPAGDPVVEDIVQRMAADNGFTKVQGYASPADFDAYMSTHPNSTQGALHFDVAYADPLAPSLASLASLSYVMQNNQTRQRYRNSWYEPMQAITIPYVAALNRAVLQFADEHGSAPSTGGSFTFDFDLQPYPHPVIAPLDVVASVGPIFFFGALMFCMIAQLNIIVGERERHLRQSMQQMGLFVSVYWVSYAIINLTMNILSSLILIAAGHIFQFSFFQKTDFPVYFVLFLMFSLSLVTMVFLLSICVSKARTGTVLGFAMFLIGTLVQTAVAIVFVDTVNVGIRIIFILQPWALLARAMSLIGLISGREGLRFTWEMAETIDPFMNVKDVYLLLLMDAAIYAVLAAYLDQVVPDDNGMSRPTCFCLTPNFWCPSSERVLGSREPEEDNKRAQSQRAALEAANNNDADEDPAAAAAAVAEQIRRTNAGQDPDVLEEVERVRATQDVNYPVRIDQLGKTYYARTCCCIRTPAKDFQAVREMNLVIGKNSLLALLGHNGAGKSTTISMMTGLLQPTAGDARVLGYSITTGMHEIKKHMGVCPQHDVLWAELTAAEHLELFAAFKNVAPEDIAAQVQERLADVDLTKYAHAQAGTFSGGMRRRLSIAIALIGDPAIVYLDEPCTGMDLVAARQVWDLIERVKVSRSIILTTHSMLEADTLADRIAIMKSGGLVCLGSSVRLKNKFGTGYRVSAFVEATKTPEQKRATLKKIAGFFKKHLPESSVDVTDVNFVRFKVPRAATAKLVTFFSALEAQAAALGVEDVQTSLTTLEEVFMTVGALGEDHADERFGVSSQVGTELTKALRRLAEIRDIEEKRTADPNYNPPAAHGMDDFDNAPEALALEKVQLLEIEAVAQRLGQLRDGLEANRFVRFENGTQDQQRQWAEARLAGAHLNVLVPLEATAAQPAGGTRPKRTRRGSKKTARVTPDKREDGSAIEMQPMPSADNGNNNNNNNNNNGSASDSDSDDEVDAYETLSVEMAIEGEDACKDFMKKALLDKPKPCCGGFRRTWRKWSCCKKIGFIFVIVLVLIIVIAIVSSIVNGSSSAEDQFPPLAAFTLAAATPVALADLPEGAWSEIAVPDPDGSLGVGCARSDTFSFFVFRPTAAQATGDALFQLGSSLTRAGVCSNVYTCNTASPVVPFDVTVDVARASFRYQNLTGVFQKDGYNDDAAGTKSAANPFAGALHVYVPGCGADGHVGNKAVAYGPGILIQHRGGNNAKQAFDWLKTAAGAATTTSNIAVAGFGAAGSLGAVFWAAHAHRDFPFARITYVGDADIDARDVGTSYAKYATAPALPAHCSNGVKDADETAVDCGGSFCTPCGAAAGTACTPATASLCASGVCTASNTCGAVLPRSAAYLNTIFETSDAATGARATSWGVNDSPALPTFVAGLASPVPAATLTVESALSAVTAHATTRFTALRLASTASLTALETAQNEIRTALPVTSANRVAATEMTMITTPIEIGLVSDAALAAADIQAAGILTRADRTAGNAALARALCDQVSVRAQAVTGTGVARTGLYVAAAADKASSLFSSPFFFSASKFNAAATSPADWVKQALTSGTAPSTSTDAPTTC